MQISKSPIISGYVLYIVFFIIDGIITIYIA
jgi:hypothetical protein